MISSRTGRPEAARTTIRHTHTVPIRNPRAQEHCVKGVVPDLIARSAGLRGETNPLMELFLPLFMYPGREAMWCERKIYGLNDGDAW